MARRTKDAPTGRVTPKGGSGLSRTPRVDAAERGRPASGRYTAPIPQEYRSSGWWVPALMLTFFGLGLVCILLNYLSVLPGGASNVYLLVGLGLIVAGFITATRWH
ncbi:MAG: cell division protein CrgA [Acidimicrobiales bacterium]